MTSKKKIGIIICDRYRRCAGGKCLRAMRRKEGAFSVYATDTELELVGFTTCDACPGGNIEYAADEMVKNGAEVFIWLPAWLLATPLAPMLRRLEIFWKRAIRLKLSSALTRYRLNIWIRTLVSEPGKARNGSVLSNQP